MKKKTTKTKLEKVEKKVTKLALEETIFRIALAIEDIALSLKTNTATSEGFNRQTAPHFNVDDIPKEIYGKFPIWKTITLGSHKDVASLKSAIEAKNYKIGSWASDLMDQKDFTISPEKVEVDLSLVSVSDLGFTGWTRYEDIQKKAVALGLQLAPAEVGPQLRLQYEDQPNDEWLRIGMEAIAGSDGDRSVFRVGRRGDGETWLGNGHGSPGYGSGADYRFVFVCPRK